MTVTKKLINKALPLLNEYIPMDTAKKGLEMLDKSFIKYFTQGTAAGYGVKELMNVLRDQFTPLGQQMEQERVEKRVKSGRARPEEIKLAERGSQAGMENTIAGTALALGAGGLAMGAGGAAGAEAAALGAGGEMINQAMGGEEELTPQREDIEVQATEEIQEGLPGQQQRGQQAPQAGPQDLFRQNPELFTFVDQIIKQGKPPSFAAQRAMRDRRFAQLIPQIEQTAQMDFTSLLEQMYGGGQGQQRQQQPGQPQQGQQPGQPQQGGDIRAQFAQQMQQGKEIMAGFRDIIGK